RRTNSGEKQKGPKTLANEGFSSILGKDKSGLKTRIFGRSVHNASEFYDEIRRDTHSDARPIPTFDLSETTK
ncbi:MAG: hypothetical protein IJT49_01840, partial [Clostridia bacterium]|nr:hypothetical protein [Clostridia bacterium]